MRNVRRSTAAAAALSAAIVFVAWHATAEAHEFWIEPSTHVAKEKSLLSARLRVGESAPGEAVPRAGARIERFEAVSDAGASPLVGLDGADPAGAVRLGGPGVVTLAYRSTRTAHEMPAEKFEAYLREDGLEAALAERARRGESKSAGREVFSRCAKSLVRVGAALEEAGERGFDRVVGLPLEMVAEASPFSAHAGDAIPVRVLHLAKPIAGVLVVLRPLVTGSGDVPVTARTDADGRVTVRPSRGGAWLVSCVHMTRAPEGVDADWESLWASLTFPIAERVAEPVVEHTAAAPPGGSGPAAPGGVSAGR